ncbi:sirohydrochlorin chelatase [Williamsia sp. D3]|uniref:sirohydrochlorin chelatase n=1 Tax=Williamsia sp. D3 TaxID=1313067 RepID=UPI0003D2FC0F|nr:sirohydrochlorin chelatase [Williamsia sp. D3]ETD34843.1 cobalamin biosynthesis protein CbiX [Williamsia sp. D3]
MTTLVLAAHGSRDPRFAATMERITHGVRIRLPGVDVRLGYLDLNSPSVAGVLAGCTGRVMVAPLLLSNAFHSKVDLPAIVSDACAANPDIEVRQLPPLGDDPRIVSALIGRLDQAGIRATDGVVLTAVGSSDPTADEAVRARAAELAVRLRTPLVQTVFATRLGRDHSDLHQALRSLRRGGARRVVVSPYFLSAGLLTERVDAAVDHLAPGSLIAGPIGAHPDLIDVVCDRFRGATMASPAPFSAFR